MTLSLEIANIFLDTDMGNDIDDALALAMLHALEARGECKLIGVSVSKDNPYAAAYVDVVNTFYGRPNIPIGLVENGVTPDDGSFVRQVVEMQKDEGTPEFDRSVVGDGKYPPAVEVLRRVLAESDDRSVVILMIGFSTNMAQFFRSQADAWSPLNGLVLFAQKVKHVVMMAADFSDSSQAKLKSSKAEYNVCLDVASAQEFVSKCPRDIYFSGHEVGSNILYPSTALATDFCWDSNHPVVEAYRRFLPMPYDRPTWDLTAVLYAVRSARGYFGLSPAGKVLIDEDGHVAFETIAGGRHRYLTVNEKQCVRIAELQEALVSQPLSAFSYKVNSKEEY